MPKRKTFKGNYAEVVKDLLDFFNERHMSAQEMFACFSWLITQYYDPKDAAIYARSFALVCDMAAKMPVPKEGSLNAKRDTQRT